MGAWGIGTFDNDDAIDWLAELLDDDEGKVLCATLMQTNFDKPYLEVSEGTQFLCACEIILALRGQPSSNVPHEALEWVKDHSFLETSRMIPLAMRAIDRVLGESSELRDLLWKNELNYSIWKSNVLALKEKLSLIH